MEQNIKNPGVAAVLSFVFNGLGQLYNGQIKKGLWIIFFSTVSLLVFIMGSILIGLRLLEKLSSIRLLASGVALFLIGLICICILGIYSIIDAYRQAAKK
jgi:TM2 domain-containing membrane protein YozV